MRTRRSTSSLISCQSEEEFIEKNQYAYKFAHPKLTFRQVKNKLQSEWNIFINKPKRQTKLDDFIIQISPSPNSKRIQKKKQENKPKLKNQKQQNKNQSQKHLKNQKNNSKKKRISPCSKQGPNIETFDSESFKISLSSQEENQPILRESPIIISTNSLQIQKVNQSRQKKKINLKKKKEETKSNSINNKKDQNKNKNKKQQINLPIKKDIKMRKLNKLSNLSKCKQINQPETISEYKPVLIQDFINSSKLYEHISVITVNKSRNEQGQVGLDEIKDIVSHTYGIINHEQNTSENLNFQLFFEVEFQPKENGYIPENTFCTSKQAAFYCKEQVLKYISNHKDIFTQNEEYYLQ
ncbi:unnamed protein product [Paramecium sonneborni]|uniref:Uncharacterized protein n=1 Tax=Paramecium sonneborni TaxID=65129 RepID=A0A8S1N396_9CILI|nr:unnamed protein product [Paramecium sonneborni]